jgi:hypothetical protein
MARLKPPTISSLFLSSWSTLFLLVFGLIVGVVPLFALDLPISAPMFVAGICLGAVLRDLGIAIKAVRFWPIQQELFNWPKIEALAQGVADAPGEWPASPPTPPSR